MTTPSASGPNSEDSVCRGSAILPVPAWFLFTLLTLLCWGGWGLVSKPLANALSPWQVQALSSLGFVPVIAVLARVARRQRSSCSRRGLGLAAASGLLSSLGNVAYYQALSAGGKAAAVTPLTALYPLVTIGLAWLLLRERLSVVQLAGVALSLAAIYCANVGGESGWLTPWLVVALLPLALWGVGALLQKLATNETSAAGAAAAFLAGEIPVALATPLFVPLNWDITVGTWGLLLLLGLFFALGNLTLLAAYGRGGKAAIVTPLASLYSLVTVPLAVLLLGERISSREGLGIMFAVVAAVALAWEKPPPSAAQVRGWMLNFGLATALTSTLGTAAPAPGTNPADALPPHIRQVTWFGERADWSLDGQRLLFLAKTFGDVMELDVATGRVRNRTAHYPHHGYTRALYLANGDLLLSGPEHFDPQRPGEARVQCWLYVLDRSGLRPAVRLGTKCSEGPAVSRSRLHIAWTHVAGQYPGELAAGSSRVQEADIVYEGGAPRLAQQQVVVDSRDLPFKCTLETQNYRPRAERELIFSAYGHQGTEVMGIDLVTKKVVNYSNAPDQYDEPEGIFPDGEHTLVECDKQNRKGAGYVDLWKLKLDGSGAYERLTHFSEYPGYKASNPVVSDDGRFIAFQLAKSHEAAGVGHGIFVLDLTRARGSGVRPTF
jgi:drug/metabolite transporter (DMT)-like permease